jgi:type II secretory pathway pseudopilin PulG
MSKAFGNRVILCGIAGEMAGLGWLFLCWRMGLANQEGWAQFATVGWWMVGIGLIISITAFLSEPQKSSLTFQKALFCLPGSCLLFIGLFLIFWVWGGGFWENEYWAHQAAFAWPVGAVGWLVAHVGLAIITRGKSLLELLVLLVILAIIATILFPVSALAQNKSAQSQRYQQQKEEADVQETVLRALFAAYGKSVPHEVYFIALAFQDPPPAFLQRFNNNTPPVLVRSRADKSSPEIRDPKTGKAGTLFSVQKMKWLSPTRVEAQWHWIYGMKAGMGATYRVEKINGKWKVKEIVPKSIFKN